jgi:hypothetical protein
LPFARQVHDLRRRRAQRHPKREQPRSRSPKAPAIGPKRFGLFRTGKALPQPVDPVHPLEKRGLPPVNRPQRPRSNNPRSVSSGSVVLGLNALPDA